MNMVQLFPGRNTNWQAEPVELSRACRQAQQKHRAGSQPSVPGFGTPAVFATAMIAEFVPPSRPPRSSPVKS